jgi:serine/threonine protein kinase
MEANSVPGYELLEARGAVGAIRLYKARERTSGRLCELSVLDAKDPSGEEHQLRFLDEGRALLGFSHPNVARIYDVGSTPETAWIAQELVEGPTLQEILDIYDEPLPVETVLALGVQVGSALSALSIPEIVHGDVCPKSILVAMDGRVALGGFGVSLESSFERLNQGHMPHDGVDFLSPEQVEGDGLTCPRTDVYGLGATLFRALSGRVPHSGSTLFTRLRAIAHDTPPDVRELNPEVPDDLAHLIARFMEWDPDDRPLSQDTLMFLGHVVTRLGVSVEGWEKEVLAELNRTLAEEAAANERTSALTIRLRGTDRTIDRVLAPGEMLDVGRAEKAAVSLCFAWVSRKHAQIERRPDGVFLVDLGASNGTTHNGTKLARNATVRLSDGDMVAFGKSTFQILFLEGAVATAIGRQCALCGKDLGQAVAEDDPSGVCLRCQVRTEADLEAAEHRIRLALEESRFEVLDRVDTEGAFKRFRVRRHSKSFIASALELGERTAKRLADASQAAFAVKHPGVVRIVDIDVRSGILIVVNEEHPGRTLEDFVASGGALAPQAAVALGARLCEIVDDLRSQGVQALVRPETILVDSSGSPMLLDVGLARGVAEAARARTGWGPQPCYEAPELASLREPTPQALVFSLGATLGFAATGTPVAETLAGERYDHLPLTMVAQVPRLLAVLLSRATAPKAKDRPASPMMLREALSAIGKADLSGGRNPALSVDEQTWTSQDKNPFDPS